MLMFGFQLSIETELEWWRSAANDSSPEAFIFPSQRGTAINTNNFLFRVLKEAGRQAGIDGVTHQMLRAPALPTWPNSRPSRMFRLIFVT